MIFLTAGHNNKDSGAVIGSRIEAKEAIKIRNRVTEILRKNSVDVWNENDNWNLQTTINEITKISQYSDIICDIHFNAAAATATGCEVFVPNEAIKSELLLANDLCLAISTTLKIRNRGVKRESDSQHKRLGMMRPNGINVLIEVAFISNPNDMKSYDTNFEKMCNEIASKLIKK